MLDSKVANALEKAQIQYEVLACQDKFADTAAFCAEYGYDAAQAANTILVQLKTEPRRIVACVISGNRRLDVNKKLCNIAGVKRASFASGEQTIEASGMKIGGVTIFGLSNQIEIFVDQNVMKYDKVIMGGGNRTSKLLLDPKELEKLPNIEVADIAQE